MDELACDYSTELKMYMSKEGDDIYNKTYAVDHPNYNIYNNLEESIEIPATSLFSPFLTLNDSAISTDPENPIPQ